MPISNRLWEVQAKTPGGSTLPDGHLWILASDAEVATRKANRWLRNNGYAGERRTSVHPYVVKAVIAHGTIDVM
jgi:hypothetical protein